MAEESDSQLLRGSPLNRFCRQSRFRIPSPPPANTVGDLPMAMFQLDPESIAARVRASGQATPLPSLAASMWRGLIGFAIVSVAGFLPWPIFGLWVKGLGEMHLYIACTAIFVGLSGVCLHRLIMGPGSLPRFYKLFSLAFVAYAIVWIALWVAWRDTAGIIGGLLGGAAAMGAIFCAAFHAFGVLPKVVGAIFVLNAAGYYAGSRVEGKLLLEHPVAAMLLWGLCYGIGFGAGLGIAFHLCQEQARALLRADP